MSPHEIGRWTRENLATPLTGDPAADQRFLESFAARDARVQLGLCPNDATLMVSTGQTGQQRSCPFCGFVYARFALS